MNTYQHPTDRWFGRFVAGVCNSRWLRNFRRFLFRMLPFVKMESDITQVVYINWLVDTEAAKGFVPEDVVLQEFGDKTFFSILTYQHGHFRPVFARWLRRFFPSPLQSNWRFYPTHIGKRPLKLAVLFLKNIMSQLHYTVGTRLVSDAMYTHYSRRFSHVVEGEKVRTEMDGENGSAPDLKFEADVTDSWQVSEEWLQHFKCKKELLEYLCFQDHAWTRGEDFEGYCKADIQLTFELESIKPLAISECQSRFLQPLIEDATPFAFLVPSVPFKVTSESIHNV